MAKHTKPGWPPLLLVLALLAVVVVLAGIFPYRQIIAGTREVEAAEETLNALREENRVLEARIAALGTPEEVERLAREQFGLVMPGEIGYVVVTPPWESDLDQAPAADAEPAGAEGSSWWEKVWDFLTGRDLVEDG